MKLRTFLLAGVLSLSASIASAATLYDTTLIPSSGKGSTTFSDKDNGASPRFNGVQP